MLLHILMTVLLHILMMMLLHMLGYGLRRAARSTPTQSYATVVLAALQR